MSKVTSLDTIKSSIAQYIREDYPLFVEFLQGYYEWLNSESGSHYVIQRHMDAVNFKDSLDSYTDFLKDEFLKNIPDNVLIDKELFIKWSRKFNLSHGSHASYKFLFKVLFNEQDTDIYLPKENILRGSDGIWVTDQNVILLTNSNSLDKFEFQRIFQERQVYEDIFEYAYADVQIVRNKYTQRYDLLELIVSNVHGTFDINYPVQTESGGFEWIIPTITSFDIVDAGFGFTQSQRLTPDNIELVIERLAEEDVEFDTRISSFLTADDLRVFVDSVEIFDFIFDGRIVSSVSISSGDQIRVEFPVYEGYVVVGEVTDSGSILSVDILDSIISNTTSADVTWSNGGSDLSLSSVTSTVREMKSYFLNTQGFLSSNMYLQDSFFYQEYSYLLRTQQSLTDYRDVVFDVLHPSGFVLFAEQNIYLLIELLLSIEEEFEFVTPEKVITVVPKYHIGPNYSFFNKFKHGLTERLYNMSDFSNEYQYMQHVVGETDYDLESDKLAIFSDYGYTSKIGWMSYHAFSDLNIYKYQDYSEKFDSGNTYFESGYVRRDDFDPEQMIINYTTIVV